MARIYLSPPHVGEEERNFLLDAFDSNWIAPLGPHVDAFEAEVAARVGVAHAVALSSGTASLLLALEVLGVGRGSEVLVPTLTFVSTASAAVHRGAIPVFVDCSADSWNLDPGLLEEELADRARSGRLPAAVVSVDLYGQCADYDAIAPICAAYEVPLVEDAAEALGATYRGAPAGRFGVAAAFSFNGNKIVTTGGGGMLVSNSEHLAGKVRHLASQARDPAPHYQHSTIGYNYRMSNLLAAVGRGQLCTLDARIERRRAIRERYGRRLEAVPGVKFMPVVAAGMPNYWLTCITVDPDELGCTAEDLRLLLEEEDIESRPTWKPLHLQPAFSGCAVRGGAVAEEIFANGLCLPSGSAMTDGEVDRVAYLIRSSAT